MPLRLRTVIRTQGNNLALKNGSVALPGVVLDFEEVPVLVHAFRRMVRETAYDVSEMAFTTYLCARAHGARFTALPIFLVRGFHHGAMVRPASAPCQPQDLEGKRVGVNRGYTVTTGVWARSVLEQEHGVDLDRVVWVPSGDEHVDAYRPPNNVHPMGPGEDMFDLLGLGRLVAAVGVEASGPLVALLPDPEEAGFAALRDRGFYPINHLVVVRDELLAATPGLATTLFDAFAAAKQRYVLGLGSRSRDADSATDVMYRRVMGLIDDPLPYGIEPNRKMIDELVQHAVRQHILDAPVSAEEIFADETHGLVA